MTTLWISGKVTSAAGVTPPAWELEGVFSLRHTALERCSTSSHFLAPVVLDDWLPEKTTDWPGIVFPISGTQA